jgi:hypothetical protein
MEDAKSFSPSLSWRQTNQAPATTTNKLIAVAVQFS